MITYPSFFLLNANDTHVYVPLNDRSHTRHTDIPIFYKTLAFGTIIDSSIFIDHNFQLFLVLIVIKFLEEK